MKLTLKEVEVARKAVERAKTHLKTIKTWDETMKKIGNIGDGQVTAIKINDGKISYECDVDETAGKPILKEA